MTTILLDVDGVLADFTGAACREASEVLGRECKRDAANAWDLGRAFDMTNKQWLAWNKRICREGFCEGLALLPGAVKAVEALNRIGHVHFVTTPWIGSPYWMHERNKWIAGWFALPCSNITHTHDKGLIRGDVIIDDKPFNCVTGDRKLRVLVPNAANARFRKEPRAQSTGDRWLVSRSWPEIIKAVTGLK